MIKIGPVDNQWKGRGFDLRRKRGFWDKVEFGRKTFDNEVLVGYLPSMDTLFAIPGYPALFILSFVASTLLPLGSEWLLIVMILGEYDPAVTVAVASVGNLLGACTTWAIGLYGGPFLIRRILRIDAGAQATAERLYGRYGLWSLLFSWLPFIGDPLCLAAGILRIDLGRFAALIFAGKLARYAAVAWLTLSGAPFLGSFGF